MPSDIFKLTSRPAAVSVAVPVALVEAIAAPRPRAQGRLPKPSRLPSDECRSILDQVLRQTVISRLRLAHPQNETVLHQPDRRPSAQPSGRPAIDPEHIEGFVQVLRFEDQAEVDRCTEWLIEEECGIEGLLLDLVPIAEARLGEHANAEGGDHADITLGQWRLAELVERVGLRFQAAATAPRHGCRVLLSATEPDTARLRLQIVAESLTHDGWDVWSDADSPLSELCEVVHCDWFALVLIASETASVEGLAGTIHALRRASSNPRLRVLLLSAALVRRPDRLARVGADAAAGDLRQLAVQAGRLLALLPPSV